MFARYFHFTIDPLVSCVVVNYIQRQQVRCPTWSLLLLVAACTSRLIRLQGDGGVERCDISASKKESFKSSPGGSISCRNSQKFTLVCFAGHIAALIQFVLTVLFPLLFFIATFAPSIFWWALLIQTAVDSICTAAVHPCALGSPFDPQWFIQTNSSCNWSHSRGAQQAQENTRLPVLFTSPQRVLLIVFLDLNILVGVEMKWRLMKELCRSRRHSPWYPGVALVQP